MCKLRDEIFYLTCLFDDLMSTNSIVEKRRYIDEVDKYKEDFDFILECLAGIHKFGYTWDDVDCCIDTVFVDDMSVGEVLNYLLEPMRSKDLSHYNIAKHLSSVYEYSEFFEPIVNRTLKLGIGKSLLPTDGYSPMLAKKYEIDKLKRTSNGYFITEKLDGNRCIARYDGTKWVFTSRNGKQMHVDFDMKGLPTEYVYDGEVLSIEQTYMSDYIYKKVTQGIDDGTSFDSQFNSTSGMINRHSKDKKLVFNIFDIMVDGVTYADRRAELDIMRHDFVLSDEVRILPTLGWFNTPGELKTFVDDILGNVVETGGEGIMINLGGGYYNHKRTDALLKYKQVQTMDMMVTGINFGTGKYEGMVGAINVMCELNDGTVIMCDVGSGLSDEQRLQWAINPKLIVGKIVEVAYFSISQDSSKTGTNVYSLRFPRLKSVRNDKIEISIY